VASSGAAQMKYPDMTKPDDLMVNQLTLKSP